MNKVTLSTDSGALAEIINYGAHLLRWRSSAGKEWIFLSHKAEFTPGKAIRGGVPIIFPQFNEFGPSQRHGFARNVLWQPVESQSNHCRFRLESNTDTLRLWPHPFYCEFQVVLTDNQLSMTLCVENTGDATFEFTSALHTYFQLNDFQKAKLRGLKNLTYWNNDGSAFSQRLKAEENDLLFSDAIDRVYFDVEQPLFLDDEGECLKIAMEHFKEVVVWNPGAEAAKGMKDFDDLEYNKMLCVEAAIIDRPICLKAGEQWRGSQILTHVANDR